MKRKTKKTPRKEEIAEDWCFVCKDGGQLLICDYKQCLKAYHTECVGKDDSFLETGSRWTCSWHSCFMCCRTPKFYCYVCPKAVCRRCIDNADFVHIKGNKGFCTHCLNLALLVEEKKDVDSDGVKVDFKDRETYEGLFREYWEIINEKEGLTVEILRSANARMVMGRNYESDSGSDADEIDEGDEDDINEQKTEHIKKKSKGQRYVMKQKVKATGKEFIGWGSKSLIQFLASIGRDTSKQLSQHDVTSIMNDYIKENKLFHPMKKKKVLCDTRLKSVLGKKTVNKNGIYYLLEAHFAENQDTSEKDELEYNLEDKDDGILVACKRQRKSNTNKVLPIKNIVSKGPHICYASIVPENIKLVYLKRSLVQELLEQPETFESKVNGSFVRVKSDPNDCLQKNTYHLVQVTGIKKCSISENNTETFLQVSDISIDICITALSDDDFSEEECEDLRQKMKGGLLKRPTVEELDLKARSLHEVITKNWIPRELSLLQNLIDRANEKGWRRELFEYSERRQLLKTSAEQSRLLHKVPTVISDVAELEHIPDDFKDDKHVGEESPKSILRSGSEIPCSNWKCDGTSSEEKQQCHHASPPKEKQHLSVSSAQKELNDVVLQREPRLPSCLKASTVEQIRIQCHILASDDQSNVIVQSEADQNCSCPAGANPNESTIVEHQPVEGQETMTDLLTELSSNDDANDKSSAMIGKQKLEDPENCLWYFVAPDGERKGPKKLSFLKRYIDQSAAALKSKAWKAGQSEENAISLIDAVNLAFPGESQQMGQSQE